MQSCDIDETKRNGRNKTMHQCHIVKQPYNLRPVRTSTLMYTEVISILSTLCTHFDQTGSKSIVSESIRLTYGRYIEVNPHEYLVGAASGMLMYIHYYTHIYVRVCVCIYVWLASQPGSILYSRLYLTYSSVAVDRDGNWLEHKDLAWHLGLIRRYAWVQSCYYRRLCVFRCRHDQS